jgi:hypothetical protein
VFRVPVFRCSGVPGFTNSHTNTHFVLWLKNTLIRNVHNIIMKMAL